MEVVVEGFGTRLRNRRLELKLTQKQLGNRAGLDSDIVSKHERGMGVSTEALSAYAQALETTMEYLSGATSDPKPRAAGSKVALRSVSKAIESIPKPLAQLLNDGRCNPLTDEEMAHLSRHLDDGNSPELDDLEVHLLAHRAERDRTEEAVQNFRNAVRRARGGPARPPTKPPTTKVGAKKHASA